MKQPFIFLLLVSSFQNTFSQSSRFNNKDVSKILNTGYVSYDLESSEKSNFAGKLPFNKITFFDVRYDTSYIAVNWQVNTNILFGANTQNKKFNLRQGLATGLTNYFKEFYKDKFSDNNAEILCYIKKLSVNLKDTLSEDRHADESINNIKLESECYYRSGSLLFPAIRIDTVYIETLARIKKTFSQLVKEIINPLINKLNNLDTSKIIIRNPYTEEQIKDRYQGRFNIPILTTGRYARGVYRNFREFKNNAPSIREFKVKTKGITTLLYDSNDNIINSLKIFGFCDGNSCWLQYGAFCSPLVRVGNSFEFLYTLYIRTNYTYVSKKLLLALNMENGRVD